MSYNLLQAYSQDAYLKGNEAYSGNAQNIPEPPPICYPRIEVKAVGMAQSSEPATVTETPRGPVQGPGRRGGTTEKSYRVEIPVPPSPGQQTSKPQTVVCVCNENARTVPPDPIERGSRVARAGPSHRTEENRYGPTADSGSARPRPLIASVPGGAQLQYPSSRTTETPVYSPSSTSRPGIYPDTLSPPGRASQDAFSTAVSPSANHYSPSPTVPSPCPHQNIDWRNYTTYKDYIDAKRLHTYGCRTIQERLDSLRAASNSSSAYTQQRTASPPVASQRGALESQVRRRSASNERGVDAGGQGAAVTAPLRSASQERLGGGGERTIMTRNWPRSASQDALPFSTPTGVAKPRARSCDYLGQHPGEVSGLLSGDKVGLEDRLQLGRGEEARASRQGAGLRALPHLSRSLTGQEEEGRGFSSSPLTAPVFTKVSTDSALPSRTDGIIMRPSRLPVKNAISDSSPALPSAKSTDTLKDQRANIMGNHLGYPSPLHLQLRCRADSLKIESRPEAGLAVRSSSCSGPSSKLPTQRQLQSGGSSSTSNGAVTQKPKVKETSSSTNALVRTNGSLAEGLEGPDATVVILRRDKNSAIAHVRPPSYVIAVNDNRGGLTHRSPPLVKAGSADAAMCWTSSDSCREMHLRRLGDTRHKSGSNNLDDSLDSIPFIGKTAFIFIPSFYSNKFDMRAVCFVCCNISSHIVKNRLEFVCSLKPQKLGVRSSATVFPSCLLII